MAGVGQDGPKAYSFPRFQTEAIYANPTSIKAQASRHARMSSTNATFLPTGTGFTA